MKEKGRACTSSSREDVVGALECCGEICPSSRGELAGTRGKVEEGSIIRSASLATTWVEIISSIVSAGRESSMSTSMVAAYSSARDGFAIRSEGFTVVLRAKRRVEQNQPKPGNLIRSMASRPMEMGCRSYNKSSKDILMDQSLAFQYSWRPSRFHG